MYYKRLPVAFPSYYILYFSYCVAGHWAVTKFPLQKYNIELSRIVQVERIMEALACYNDARPKLDYKNVINIFFKFKCICHLNEPNHHL